MVVHISKTLPEFANWIPAFAGMTNGGCGGGNRRRVGGDVAVISFSGRDSGEIASDDSNGAMSAANIFPHYNPTHRSAPSHRRGEGWGEGALVFAVFFKSAQQNAPTQTSGGTRQFASRHRLKPLTLTLSPQGRGDKCGPPPAASLDFIHTIDVQQNLAPDCFEYAIEIFNHLVVPEADDAEAEGFDHLGACCIGGDALNGAMLTTIEFDDKFDAAGAEISDGVAYRFLPHEFDIFNLPSAQARPEFALDIGGIAAQASGGANKFSLCHKLKPLTLALSPQGRGNPIEYLRNHHAQTH
jgi:hypothetical protein